MAGKRPSSREDRPLPGKEKTMCQSCGCGAGSKPEVETIKVLENLLAEKRPAGGPCPAPFRRSRRLRDQPHVPRRARARPAFWRRPSRRLPAISASASWRAIWRRKTTPTASAVTAFRLHRSPRASLAISMRAWSTTRWRRCRWKTSIWSSWKTSATSSALPISTSGTHANVVLLSVDRRRRQAGEIPRHLPRRRSRHDHQDRPSALSGGIRPGARRGLARQGARRRRAVARLAQDWRRHGRLDRAG